MSTRPAFEPGFGSGTALAAASTAVFASGILMAFTFSAAPWLAHHPSQIGLANGPIAQLGSIGAFLSPPLVVGLVSWDGWRALSLLLIGFNLAFVGQATDGDVVRGLAADGMTLVMITHEMTFARDVCSRVDFMHRGRVHEIGAPQEMFTTKTRN